MMGMGLSSMKEEASPRDIATELVYMSVLLPFKFKDARRSVRIVGGV